MSIWYLLVNETKKEFIDSMDFGFSGKDWSYTFQVAPLLGYLMLDHYGVPNTEEQYNFQQEFYFEGHWAHDNVHLVMEQTPLYEKLHGLDHGWMNISKPLAEQWNQEIDEWQFKNLLKYDLK